MGIAHQVAQAMALWIMIASPSIDAAEWYAMRAKWDQFHSMRVALDLIAMSALLVNVFVAG